MEGAFIVVTAYALGPEQCAEPVDRISGQPRRTQRDGFEGARRRRQQRGHAELAGQPAPQRLATGQLVPVRGPAPAVPADPGPICTHNPSELIRHAQHRKFSARGKISKVAGKRPADSPSVSINTGRPRVSATGATTTRRPRMTCTCGSK